MIQTKRLDQNRLDQPRLPGLLAILAILAILGLGWAGYDYVTRPVAEHQPGYALVAYELPAVPANFSIAVDGNIQVTVPTDVGMPTPPNCKDYGMAAACKWAMKWSKQPGTEKFDSIQVELRSGNEVMSRVQMTEIDLIEVEQVAGVDMAGHQTGWIAHVQVMRQFMANGLGKLTWQAGDAALRIWAGANGANSVVRIIADTAGWGQSLMANVPQEAFLFADDPIWIYIVQKG